MIEEFRQVWSPGEGDLSHPEPWLGRGSAAKVGRWALERAADILASWGRTPLRIAPPASMELTPHERSLRLIVMALAQGDAETARSHATWLVRPAGINPLLRALQPIARGAAQHLG